MRTAILVVALTLAGLVDAAAQKPPIITRPPAAQRVSPTLIAPPRQAPQDRAIHPPGAGSLQRRPFDITTSSAATTLAEGVRARTQNDALCDAVPLEVAPPGGFRTLETTQFPCLRWREAVAWVSPDGGRTRYDQWPAARKARLEQFYRAILTDEPDLGVACPASPVLSTALTERQAEDIYLVHVAHALALEQRRLVPWRMWRLPAAELAVLIAPEHHVARTVNASGQFSGYMLPDNAFAGRAFDCDPRVGFRFLQGVRPNQTRPLLGATEEETLRRITMWFRDEVGHGGYSYEELAAHAHLADRLTRYQSYSPPPLVSYWAVMGCHSAAPLFRDIARSANIPVLAVARGAAPGQATGHAGLIFRWARGGARVLQHADDIYALESIVFPLTPDGRAASQEEADRQYFDAHWITPDALRGQGFDFGLVELIEGPPAAANHRGWTIGAWRNGESAATATARGYELEMQFRLEKAHDLVASEFVALYCTFSWRATTDGWSDLVANRSGRPTARPITDAQLLARVSTAIAAYGGCDGALAIKARAEAFKWRPAGR